MNVSLNLASEFEDVGLTIVVHESFHDRLVRFVQRGAYSEDILLRVVLPTVAFHDDVDTCW